MAQNHELFCQFGPYPAHEVVPEHVFVGHDLPLLIERGLVKPTDKAVTVALVAPEPVKAAGPPDDVLAERNRLAAENKALRANAAKFDGFAQELAKQRDAFKARCDEYTVECEHLKGACTEHQRANDALAATNAALAADNAALRADLDAATAPRK